MAASPAVAGGTNFDDLERDLDAFYRGGAAGEELNMFRSGSAPPTVEGSRAAFNNHFGVTGTDLLGGNSRDARGSGRLSEEEMRAHPDYLTYYYSHEHLNPRLPPPAISKEDWRASQRLRAPGDWRRSSDAGAANSLFSLQPGMRDAAEVRFEVDRAAGRSGVFRDLPPSGWLNTDPDGLIGLSDAAYSARRKSFADALQGESRLTSPITGRLPRPGSHGAFDNLNSLVASGLSQAELELKSELSGLHSSATSPSLVRVQSYGSSNSFAAAMGSLLSRNGTPEPDLMRRTPSPGLPPVGVKLSNRNKSFEGVGPYNPDECDTTAALALSNLSLLGNGKPEQQINGSNQFYRNVSSKSELFNGHSDAGKYMQQQTIMHDANEESSSNLESAAFQNNTTALNNVNIPTLATDIHSKVPMQSSHLNAHMRESSASLPGPSALYQNGDNRQFDVLEGNSKVYGSLSADISQKAEIINLLRNQGGFGLQAPVVDPMYARYLQTFDPAQQVAGTATMNPYSGRNFGSAHWNSSDYEKAFIGALLAQQKLNFGAPFMGKSGGLSNSYGMDQGYGIGMPLMDSATAGSFAFSPSQNRSRHGERSSRGSGITRGTAGDSWKSENGRVEDALLDEFKNNKSRVFELVDIVGHVYKFSSDQYGSRFIQQKLETASVDEKNKIFPEILSEAGSLINDVFGNYVIQKFFEHGTESHIRQLAALLKNCVLELSRQMYGCRVIQKALEVVDVEQQTQMALELDGSIMDCVRDQNGNHVIQKCIERIPQDRIQFIISAFYGHVVELSMHPYGCRVIQRVLEYCNDPSTQSTMMQEIMQAVCILTQDQYGNYVIQHVLQHGKPEERSAIISNLSGQIVKFSQQKFASNVVEKCLTHGTVEEKQLLINEMLGSTDENEPLQAMMKDQFANYVVQKVLETCDDRNRELILSRIKVHLNALKRYTYGKHIVARVEKLIAAGERRSRMSSSSS